MTKVISLRKKRNIPIKIEKRSLPKTNYEELRRERFKILLAFSAIAGLLCGSFIYRTAPDTVVNSLIEDKVFLLKSGGFLQVFLFLLQLDAVFLLFSFLSGTSFIGTALSVSVPFLKCILIGYTGALFYNEYELKGVLFCLLLLYPYFTVTTASLIFSSNESIYMSKYLFGLLKQKNTADDISVRLYLLRNLLLVIINIACTAVNSLLITFIAPRISLH